MKRSAYLLPFLVLALGCSKLDGEDDVRIPGASLSSMGGPGGGPGVPLGAAMDGVISDRVREAILADRTLSPEASTVRVSTKDGVVTLSGSVSTAPRKERMGIVANSVGSVVRVDNELAVSSQPTVPSQPMETSVDREISDRVRLALAQDAALSLEASGIQVATQGGIVLLTGKVSGATARDRASIVARSVGSVVQVENRLSTPGS